MKLGDKVKITRAFTDEEFPLPGWCPSMQTQVGLTGEIVKSGFCSFDVKVKSCDDVWTWPEECLELVEETPKTAEELIRSISINRANLQYIIDQNRINGSLLHDIKHIMEEYAEQARREERERHAELISGIKEWMPAEHPCSAFRYELEKVSPPQDTERRKSNMILTGEDAYDLYEENKQLRRDVKELEKENKLLRLELEKILNRLAILAEVRQSLNKENNE